jgi:hypothetical protein
LLIRKDEANRSSEQAPNLKPYTLTTLLPSGNCHESYSSDHPASRAHSEWMKGSAGRPLYSARTLRLERWRRWRATIARGIDFHVCPEATTAYRLLLLRVPAIQVEQLKNIDTVVLQQLEEEQGVYGPL